MKRGLLYGSTLAAGLLLVGCEDYDVDKGDVIPEPVEEEEVLMCVQFECTEDTDCTAPTPKCVSGLCQQCAANADCAANAAGTRCITLSSGTKVCACATDAQCTAPLGLCRNTGCVCSEDAGCAGIGPERCSFGKCIVCDADEDCTTPGKPKCYSAKSVAAKCGCGSDTDCTNPTKPKCATETGTCVCTSTTNAAGEVTATSCTEDGAKMCADDGTCVCKDDADCTAGGLGDKCVEGECTCTATSQCTASADPGFTYECK